jgi:hypothetical protein
VKVGEANEAHAAKLNKTADSLTDAEKKTAFYEAAMEAARRKSIELGDQTKTLGEIAQTERVNLSNVATQTATNINVGVGAIVTDMRQFVTFLQNAQSLGVGMAIQLAAGAERAKAPVGGLAAALKQARDEQNQGGPAFVAYDEQLRLAAQQVAKLTTEQRNEIKTAQDLGAKTS